VNIEQEQDATLERLLHKQQISRDIKNIITLAAVILLSALLALPFHELTKQNNKLPCPFS